MHDCSLSVTLTNSVQVSCDADTQGNSLITILIAPVLLTSAPPQQRLHRWDSFRHK